MARSICPFQFDDSGGPVSASFLAEMPTGIRTKEALLCELYQRLHFPDYFGNNWDALVECIRDLSWLPAGPVVLRHNDLPRRGDVASQKTYLSILRDAVEKRWALPGQRLSDLVVVFPAEAREQILWLLRLAADGEMGS